MLHNYREVSGWLLASLLYNVYCNWIFCHFPLHDHQSCHSYVLGTVPGLTVRYSLIHKYFISDQRLDCKVSWEAILNCDTHDADQTQKDGKICGIWNVNKNPVSGFCFLIDHEEQSEEQKSSLKYSQQWNREHNDWWKRERVPFKWSFCWVGSIQAKVISRHFPVCVQFRALYLQSSVDLFICKVYLQIHLFKKFANCYFVDQRSMNVLIPHFLMKYKIVHQVVVMLRVSLQF